MRAGMAHPCEQLRGEQSVSILLPIISQIEQTSAGNIGRHVSPVHAEPAHVGPGEVSPVELVP